MRTPELMGSWIEFTSIILSIGLSIIMTQSTAAINDYNQVEQGIQKRTRFNPIKRVYQAIVEPQGMKSDLSKAASVS